MSKVNIRKAFDKLPYEAQYSIELVMTDDGMKFEDLTIQFMIKEVKWVIEKLGMDIEDETEDNEIEIFKRELKGCKKWYSYYKRYDKYIGLDYFSTNVD